MIANKRVLALIPARRGSKGLPMKNIRPLAGRPLLAWPVAAALASRYVDRVIVSTDDAEFADIARAAGATVPFLRPPELASDTATSQDVVLHALDALAADGEVFDLVTLLEPTSPLTQASDIDRALEELGRSREVADAIVGITKLVDSHPAFTVRMNAKGALESYGAQAFPAGLRRQDLEALYRLDGSLYISDTAALRREGGFYHGRTLGYETPRWQAFEIDDLLDFICVEAIVSNRALIHEQEVMRR